MRDRDGVAFQTGCSREECSVAGTMDLGIYQEDQIVLECSELIFE